MYLTTFLGSIFFAVGIFAAPRPEHGAEWPARRGLSSGGLQHVGNTTFGPQASTQVTLNWAGAVIYPPAGESFANVAGTFTVPPPGAAGTIVGIWVGLGGDNVPGSLVQGGIFISVDSNGAVGYFAFTEWLPAASIPYDQTVFQFAPGDVLTISIEIISSTEALLVIQDLTNSNVFEKLFSPTDSSQVAGVQTAEWVVEHVLPYPLMDYGSVTFSSCSALTNKANTVGLSGATSISTQRSGTDKTIVSVGSIVDQTTVNVLYTGP